MTRPPMRPASRDSYLDFVRDQLAGLGNLRVRRMFGGAGIYSGDWFFAIVYGETLYFKVDDGNRADYVSAGSPAFTPYPHRPVSLNYYAVPAAVLDDPDELVRWARAAIGVAKRAPKTKKK